MPTKSKNPILESKIPAPIV